MLHGRMPRKVVVVEIEVAALFVDEHGPYTKLKNVHAYGLSRDARLYIGNFPVVAHPPCERWGRYATGGPNPLAKRRRVGADGGCFKSALANARRCGGVIEHPAHSKAWAKFKLPVPDRSGGWSAPDEYGGRSCHIEQGRYGHPARKATWLYAVKCDCDAHQLKWGPAKTARRLDLGPHSKEEAKAMRKAGTHKAIGKRLSKDECVHTPIELRDALLALARSAR